MKTIMLLAAGFLLVGSAWAAVDGERAYRSTQEDKEQGPFAIGEDQQLRIPDWVSYTFKRKKYVMEIVQGEEARRFEPIMSMETAVSLEEITPQTLLQAKKRVYDNAFALACKPYDRGEGDPARVPDGLSVTFTLLPAGRVLEATTTLFDYNDDYREQILSGLDQIVTGLQKSYDALLQLSKDLSDRLEKARHALEEMKGSITELGAERLAGVEKRLGEITASVETIAISLEDNTNAAIAGLRTKLETLVATLHRELQQIQSEIKSSNER